MKPLILVTGGNGFLAQHIINALLTADYPVRATLRSLAKAPQLKQSLAQAGVPHLDRLSFVAANLTQDAGWSAAMADVQAVMSVAAPVFVNGERVASAVVATAQAGTERILRAATAAGVQRVVMTGNLGAVGFSHFDQTTPVTEADWTDPNQAGLSLYEKSKLLAEQAAWQFVADHHDAPQLVTVNAGAMLGPSLDGHVSGSFGIIDRLLAGKPTPKLPINIVDVRDVAALHVRALANPIAAGQRYLAVASQPLDMAQMITIIRQARPELAPQLPKHLIPTWCLQLLAPFNSEVRGADLMMRINHDVRTTKAQQQLGWQPQYTATQAVTAALANFE
ncbi:NAD-dependent epimerase/dehydratase family protein [Lactiplantibacillus fabifermentans]|uniref:Oxidoreductase n=2 Tax=Lactiplantibacillus fabifermentans TaxID=483011 RepID=A0A0R2NTC8_9LACO|nr:NAD-dependent epimerase/dehydratase family protein [Lactiplantibacillus fabifermentans]ETY74638.1 NAD-dependent dehydratase [Lactiplantibacillus fabifermentans T30PCM01]KRO28162.1 oxidoreductase [Lactiplantibacillus fabifermentans DSM 21115]